MTLSLGSKPTGVTATFGYAFADVYGTGALWAPVHASMDADGNIFSPATEDTAEGILEQLQSGPYASEIVQTNESISQGEIYTLPANSDRKSLRWMVTGPGAVCVFVGTEVPQSNTAGMVYDGAPQPGQQGSGDTFEGTSVPTNAFIFLAVADTTLVIWEGE